MNIMNEYTYHQIKKNKRHTISILLATAIASALLFSLCIFLYSFWQSKIITTIETTGYWHGELYDSIAGDKLKTIIDNPDVECTMVKGTWVTAQLTDTKRPYLLLRDGDQNFWQDMALKNTLMEGRLPEKQGEIVLAKQFFSDNSTYHIGDILTIPVGERMLGDKVLNTQSYKHDNETFRPVATNTYTIVGTLDVSGLSAYPGYIAMGYLSITDIYPSDQLTVYMRLTHPGNIYKTLPDIAQSAGLSKNELGQYGIKYNTALLNLYGISSGDHINIQLIVIITMVVILLLLVMGTFILIIYNAFSLSANSRSRELSILKSLGATPKQIKYSVLYEGLLLWLIQSPIGLVIGYVFSYGIFSKMNGILSATEDYKNMKLSSSWIVIAISLVVSLITVLISAYIPAKRMAKVPAVEGIQQQADSKMKRQKNYLLLQKAFGIEGELAGKQFAANRKSLRTAILSLSLCLILIVSYINIISIYNLAQNKNAEITQYDMSVGINILENLDSTMIQDICSLPEVKDSVIHRQVRTSTYITEEQESAEFSNVGGFSSVGIKYSVVQKDEKFKIIVHLVGLENHSFRKYCEIIGTDPNKFYEAKATTGILLDSTYHMVEKSKTLTKLPMLNWDLDAPMHLLEQVYDDGDTDGSYEIDVHIGAVTELEPGDLGIGRYSVALILPMEEYQKISASFMPNRSLEINRMSIDLIVDSEDSATAKDKIQKICSTYLGTEDFTVWSLSEEQVHDGIVQKAISVAVYAVAIMFGIIGIFNAFSTVSNNIRLHKREYAMLRSIGLTPDGLNKMLTLEGFLFSLSPIVISIPIILLICWYMLNLTAISWHEFASVFPGPAIFIYGGCMFVTIFLAYFCSSKTIKRDNIIESIQNEIV